MNSNVIEWRRENKGYSSSPCVSVRSLLADVKNITVMELFSECV